MWLVCQRWLCVVFFLPLPFLLQTHPLFLSVVTLPASPFLQPPLSSYFFLGPVTVSGTSSLVLSASRCLSQLLTFIFLSPSTPTCLFFFQWRSIRVEQVVPTESKQQFLSCSLMSSYLWQIFIKASGCFRYMHTFLWIHAHTLLCMVMNYSLCFHWAAAWEMGWEGKGWKGSELEKEEAVAVSWGMGVCLLIILVHSLNVPKQFE